MGRGESPAGAGPTGGGRRYRVEFTPGADRELEKLPPADRRRVAARIDALSEDPRPHGVEKLTDRKGLYRVRAGDYRVIYQIKDDVLLVTIVKVAPRNEAYR